MKSTVSEKVILDMPMPETCRKCKLCIGKASTNTREPWICIVLRRGVNDGTRLPNCPLSPIKPKYHKFKPCTCGCKTHKIQINSHGKYFYKCNKCSKSSENYAAISKEGAKKGWNDMIKLETITKEYAR